MPAQQVLILRDYVACHSVRSRDGEPAVVQDLSIPVIGMQKIRTTLGRAGDVDAPVVEVVDEEWLALEEQTLETKRHTSHVLKHEQLVFSDLTDNRTRPVTSVGGK